MGLPLVSGKATVTTTGTVVAVPENGDRKGLILSNTGINTEHFSFHGTAKVDEGFELAAGQKVILEGLDTYKNALRAIVAADTETLVFEEI